MHIEKKLALIYRHTHRDYKGRVNGVRSILILRDGGTQLVPLTDLNSNEIERELAYALKKEGSTGGAENFNTKPVIKE